MNALDRLWEVLDKYPQKHIAPVCMGGGHTHFIHIPEQAEEEVRSLVLNAWCNEYINGQHEFVDGGWNMPRANLDLDGVIEAQQSDSVDCKRTLWFSEPNNPNRRNFLFVVCVNK